MTGDSPPAPTYVELHYSDESCDSGYQDEVCRWVEARWPKQEPANIDMRIYAVKECWHKDTPGSRCAIPGDDVVLGDIELVCTADAASGLCPFKMRPRPPGSTTFLDRLPGSDGAKVYAHLAQTVDQDEGSKAWIPMAALA